jgi:hypothetical protein
LRCHQDDLLRKEDKRVKSQDQPHNEGTWD